VGTVNAPKLELILFVPQWWLMREATIPKRVRLRARRVKRMTVWCLGGSSAGATVEWFLWHMKAFKMREKVPEMTQNDW